MTDPIADMLTRIRNSIMVKQAEVLIPLSNLKQNIAKILEQEGFISKYETMAKSAHQGPMLRLFLKYKDGQPAIRTIDRVSKPGRKVYQGYKNIPKMLPTLGIRIVSTSRGLMTNAEAKRQKLGGEVICEIS